MTKVLTDEKHYAAIADAIRSVKGGTDKYKPAEMAPAIKSLKAGGHKITIKPTIGQRIAVQITQDTLAYTSDTAKEKTVEITAKPKVVVTLEELETGGYTLGTLVIDGQDTADTAYAEILSRDLVISATDALPTQSTGADFILPEEYAFGMFPPIGAGAVFSPKLSGGREQITVSKKEEDVEYAVTLTTTDAAFAVIKHLHPYAVTQENDCVELDWKPGATAAASPVHVAKAMNAIALIFTATRDEAKAVLKKMNAA